jgi:nicotinate-nucleotide adenylyltransferase
VASGDDRLEMINLAAADTPGLTASDVELNRSGPSYTIDTVWHFKHTFADDTRIYLMMGLDAFLDIDTWKSVKKLLEEVPFIVIARPDEIYTDARQGWIFLGDYLKTKLSEDYEFSASHSGYMSEGKQPIHICDVKALDISSTKIRKRVNKGQSIESLVPDKVAEFIKSKGLYK